MEPITTALIAGATAGFTKIGSQLVNDCYTAIKTAIANKLGSQSDAMQALERLENKPDSEVRKGAVAEDLADLDIHNDTELATLAKYLLDAIDSEPAGAQHIKNIQNVIGNGNMVVGPGSTVTISSHKK